MVVGKIFEDAACRMREHSIWCEQCTGHHPVHTQEPCLIFFVTEDQELAHVYKSYAGGLCDTSFPDLLENEGITHSQMIHIEYINVRDGGAFADNQTLLSNLIARECNCRCFIFWNVGMTFLLPGGSVTELCKINKYVEAVVDKMGVQIRNTRVDLKHKFVLVPLVYSKTTRDRDFMEMDIDRAAGNTPVVGQSLSDVKKSYPSSYKELSDPNELLALKTLKSTCTAFGKEYSTVRYSLRDGNNPKDSKMMNDRDGQNYMVSLVQWVK